MIIQLVSCKNQALLVWRNSFSILDHCLCLLNSCMSMSSNFKSFAALKFDKNNHLRLFL